MILSAKIIGFLIGVLVVQAWRVGRAAWHRPALSGLIVLAIVLYVAVR